MVRGTHPTLATLTEMIINGAWDAPYARYAHWKSNGATLFVRSTHHTLAKNK